MSEGSQGQQQPPHQFDQSVGSIISQQQGAGASDLISVRQLQQIRSTSGGGGVASVAPHFFVPDARLYVLHLADSIRATSQGHSSILLELDKLVALSAAPYIYPPTKGAPAAGTTLRSLFLSRILISHQQFEKNKLVHILSDQITKSNATDLSLLFRTLCSNPINETSSTFEELLFHWFPRDLFLKNPCCGILFAIAVGKSYSSKEASQSLLLVKSALDYLVEHINSWNNKSKELPVDLQPWFGSAWETLFENQRHGEILIDDSKTMSRGEGGFLLPQDAHNIGSAANHLTRQLSTPENVVNLLRNLGPSCATSVSRFRETLREIGAELDEKCIAAILCLLASQAANVSSEEEISNIVVGMLLPSTRNGSEDVDELLSERTNDSPGLSNSASRYPVNYGWNVDAIRHCLAEDYGPPKRNWDDIARYLDNPSFEIKSVGSFLILLDLYQGAAQRQLSQFIMLAEWDNAPGQLSLLAAIASSQTEVYSFSLDEYEQSDLRLADGNNINSAWACGMFLDRLLQLSDYPQLYPIVGKIIERGVEQHPFVIMCSTCRLHQRQSSSSPGIRRRLTMWRDLLLRFTIPLLFQPDSIYSINAISPAIRQLWTLDRNLLASCVESWMRSIQGISNISHSALKESALRIVEIIRRLGPESLGLLLNQDQHIEFSITVACAAADQNMISLIDWYSERISALRLRFLIRLIVFLKEHSPESVPREKCSTTCLVSEENLLASLKFLENLDSSILNEQCEPGSSPLKNDFKIKDGVQALVIECVQSHPHFRDLVSTTAQVSGDEIEEMANSYFQKIYTSENGIDEVIEMLKCFKISGKTQETDIFACMIHNLFDEYRFFSKYPEKELRITGILFGKLIKEQLVSSITLGIALRYVLEALRKPPGEGTNSPAGKMFRFGMFALEQFKERLQEWPQYCSHITQIPHLREGYEKLIQEIDEAGSRVAVAPEDSSSRGSSVAHPVTASGTVTPLGSAPSSPRDRPRSRTSSGEDCLKMLPSGFQNDSRGLTGMEINPDAFSLQPVDSSPPREAVFGPGLGRAVENEFVELQAEAPTDATKDRVQFIINNLSSSNLESKAKELQDVLSPSHFAWFSQILVAKRIQSQLNLHSLYLKLLDQLGDYGKGLVEAILENVYWHVGKHLRSPKITTSTSERSLLKNLGSWLGQMTLARNRPILQLTLDCKELLYQGYETGRLIAVTPFVAMILQGAKNSVVFKPPNPWVMGLLGVFRALYDVDALKMNIKFEVEVLCKNLGVRLDDIPARTSDLSKRIAPNKEKNPDFNVKNSTAVTPSTASSGSATPTKSTAPLPSVPASSTKMQAAETVTPKLADFVTINPQLYQLAGVSPPTLQRSAQMAVDRAINEVIQPIIERSVTIACITTKDIVTKDFATANDENIMRKGGRLMASNLAGSLALVTCRDPLRSSLANHLRTLISADFNRNASNGVLNDQEKVTIEQIVSSCAADNIDFGCTVVEKAASEKAIRDIDEALAPAFEARKTHREQTGQPYYDMSIFGCNARYPAALPELLRPKVGGLRPDELAVYEAFSRVPRELATTVLTNAPINAASVSLPSSGSVASPFPSNLNAVPSGSLTPTPATQQPQPPLSIETLSNLAGKLNASVTELFSAHGPRAAEITLSMLPPDHQIRQLLVAVQRYVAASRTHRALSAIEQEAVLTFAQSVFKRLYDISLSEPLRLEVFVALLESLNECCPQLGHAMGTWATYAPTETDTQRKLHLTILLLLVRSHLVRVSEVDDFLVKNVDRGSNTVWLDFAVLFIRAAVLERIATASDMPKIMDVLTKIVEGRGLVPQQSLNAYLKPISKILEEVRGSYGPTSSLPSSPSDQPRASSPSSVSFVHATSKRGEKTMQAYSSISTSLDVLSSAARKTADAVAIAARNDPPGTRQQVTMLLESWIRLNIDASGSEKALAQYLQLLQQNGVGKVEEQTERFFRHSTELVVEAVLASAQRIDSRQQTVLNYTVADSYTKLVVLLIRYMNSGGSQEQVALQRISLLNKILGITARCLMASYERSKNSDTHWDQRPWFRILLRLLCDVNAPSPAFDSMSLGIITVFGSAFHVIQPLVIPGFSFAWLELVSHRIFLSKLLLEEDQKGWEMAHQLLIDLFLFLEPHLRRAELTDAIKHFYKGTLRVLLVLLHDFPSFLAGYHLSFCNVIPDNCIQLRNLILSAFPRYMVLPDPFTPNLKIDLLPEISQSPTLLSNVVGPLGSLRADLESYLKTRNPPNFVNNLLPQLYDEGGMEIDTPMINSLVLHVGIQAIAKLQNSQIAHTPEMEVFQKLMEFDDRNRYICLNAISNQLRYPSSHTHYFSCVMLFLFSEAKDESVKEQITRVLLERLIVHRPHPWGLLITFIELIKNQRYQFWNHPFTRCATEIERIFESVARSCLTPASQRAVSAGGDP